MKNIVTILIGILVPFLSMGQYLPVQLGESVNSAYDEINPVLSPSGDTLYFSRIGHPENRLGKGNNQDIWFSVQDGNGNWTTAERMEEPFNRGRYNALFAISPDGKQALINGVFTRKGKFYKERGLSIITRKGDVWGNPEKVEVKKLGKMMDGRYFSADMDWDQGVILMSFSKGINSKRSKLFVSHRKKNNKFSKPERLKALDAPGNEFAPFISQAGQRVIFATDRWKDKGFDVLMAERQTENWKEWSSPSLMLGPVNSLLDELFYKEYESGAYYSSDTAERGNMDIYFLKK